MLLVFVTSRNRRGLQDQRARDNSENNRCSSNNKGKTMLQTAIILFGGFESSFSPGFFYAARERGLTVLVIDRPMNRRGCRSFINAAIPQSFVSEVLLCEPHDYRRMLEETANWARRYRLVGLFNTTEEFVVASAHMAALFGFVGPGMFAALVSVDKGLQRRLFHDFSPAVYHDASSAAKARFPLYVKPAGRHGGSGLKLIADAVQMTREIEALSKESFLLEEYIEGLDCSIETLVQDQRIVYVNITEEHSLPPPLGHLEMGYSMPPQHVNERAASRVYAMNRIIVSALRVQAGICHIEYRVDANDNVFLMEVAVRPPGDSLLDMYRLSVGAPMEPQILNCVLGGPVHYSKPTRPVKQKFFVHEEGLFMALNGLPSGVVANVYPLTRQRPYQRSRALDAQAGIDEVLLHYSPGDQLPGLSDASTRIGSFVYSAPDTKTLEEFEQNAVRDINVVQSTEEKTECLKSSR